jgi:predicted nicotinamide N-methyase
LGTRRGAESRRRPIDPISFIRDNTRLAPVRGVPAIALHTAHEATGLWRLAAADGTDDAPPPYWAFPWAGGMALARYLFDHPEAVAGRRVLDLGSGSGLVAIAAMKVGAAAADAADIDPFAIAAIGLNAAANSVAVRAVAGDLTESAAPVADVVTVGDLFYERALAEWVTAFLDRCRAAGATVLIGDPGRAYLPVERLTCVGEYATPDVGDVEGTAMKISRVFVLEDR